MIGGSRKMIKEKYIQLHIYRQIRGIYTMVHTRSLCLMLKNNLTTI